MIAINAAGYAVPWADLLLFIDHTFFQAHSHMVRAFDGAVWTLSRKTHADHPEIPRLMMAGEPLLGAGEHPIRMSANSGQTGLATAISLGAKRVVMLGFDYKLAPDGASHSHPHYGGPNKKAVGDHWLDFIKGWGQQARAAGVFVLNASPDSAIDEFMKCELGTLFDELQGS